MTRLTLHARRLRHDETDAERRLWHRLRGRQCGGAKFRRQHPIPPFIADDTVAPARERASLRLDRYAGPE
ncbi:MAG: DUF559 domain-containing protein [bacterium]